jgi:hypothetical protein
VVVAAAAIIIVVVVVAAVVIIVEIVVVVLVVLMTAVCHRDGSQAVMLSCWCLCGDLGCRAGSRVHYSGSDCHGSGSSRSSSSSSSSSSRSRPISIPQSHPLTFTVLLQVHGFHGVLVSLFQASVKNINHEHKNETAHIAELLIKLKADSPDLAEKVSELQRADKYVL